jgi:hypothetical protein
MVPVESALRGFFKPVAKRVHARLRRTKCIPFAVNDGDEAKYADVDESCLEVPSRVVMASDAVREVVSPELLFNLTAKRYIREGVDVPPDVASELGIDNITVRDPPPHTHTHTHIQLISTVETELSDFVHNNLFKHGT